MTSDCQSCRSLFDSLPQNDKYADALDRAHPNCACEEFSLSQFSPGKVRNGETIYRMIILPGDLDDLERLTFESVKAAYKNGLSVFRECASDEDIRFLAEDRLYVKKGAKARTIHGFIQLSTSEVRQLEHLETVGRICCIYDQTVKRKFDPDLPHVPSHAAIFQRSLPAETENKKNKLQKACEVLFHYMKEKSRWIDVGSFRDGLFVDLNEASLAGKYIYEPPG